MKFYFSLTQSCCFFSHGVNRHADMQTHGFPNHRYRLATGIGIIMRIIWFLALNHCQHYTVTRSDSQHSDSRHSNNQHACTITSSTLVNSLQKHQQQLCCHALSRHTVVCRAAQEAGAPHREYIYRKKVNAIFTPL